MKVFIATPSMGGIVTTAYARTLMATTMALSEIGAEWRYQNIDSADLVTARNLIANAFLRDEECTHLLFIDSDMAVEVETALRILTSKRAFVGAIYPERQVNIDVLAQANAAGQPKELALAKSLKFNVKLHAGTLTVKDDFIPVAGIGFGYVLTEKGVFSRLVGGGHVRTVRSARMAQLGVAGEAYDFFGKMPQENEIPLSDDYSFCKRVAALGDVTMWGWTGAGVHHVGPHHYGAPFIDRLKADYASGSAPPSPQG